MAYFQTKNTTLGKFWRALERKVWVYLEHFKAIWYILWSSGYLGEIRYAYARFGILCQEKSGNPLLRVTLESGFRWRASLRSYEMTVRHSLINTALELIPTHVRRSNPGPNFRFFRVCCNGIKVGCCVFRRREHRFGKDARLRILLLVFKGTPTFNQGICI
jgi:hypothetical protein